MFQSMRNILTAVCTLEMIITGAFPLVFVKRSSYSIPPGFTSYEAPVSQGVSE